MMVYFIHIWYVYMYKTCYSVHAVVIVIWNRKKHRVTFKLLMMQRLHTCTS